MSTPHRLIPGMPFPHIALPTTDGPTITLGDKGWRALFVIRGAHCQICRAYLGQLEARRAAWEARGIDVLVASADPVETSRAFMQEAGYQGRAVCGLDVHGMQALGLWMTGPEVSKLNYVHPESGFFLIDPDGNVAASEASTLPSARPDLEWLDRGFVYIIKHDVRPPFGRYVPALQRQGETVLLTGATGYVGAVVAEKLRAAGYAVRGLTRSPSKAAQLEAMGVAPVVGEVNDASLMASAAKGVSAIVHTATPGAPAPGESMEQMIADAMQATALLADLAATCNARLIVTSGASMYGPTEGQIVDETSPLRVPPFAAPLAQVETALTENGRAYVIRLGVVYGREQSGPMRALIKGIRERGAPAIVNPANRLAVVHVDDAADLYMAILEAETPPAVLNSVTSILPWPEVMGAIAKAAGLSGEPDMLSLEEAATLGGPAIYLPVDMAVSGERAKQQMGWQPKGPDFEADITADS